MGDVEEHLFKQRVQFRNGADIILDEPGAIEFEQRLPPKTWNVQDVSYALLPTQTYIYFDSASVWFVGEVVGSAEVIEHKIVSLDKTVELKTR